MSLITDTLNKMKKESLDTDDDDKMMAPPSLRNAIVNTKKYKEFVKSAELRDINGNKAPLKGFIAVSAILLVSIAIAFFFFMKKEDDNLIKKAGISSQNVADTSSQPNKAPVTPSQNNTNTANNKVESLGRPYGSSEPLNNSGTSMAAKSAPVKQSKAVTQEKQVVNNPVNNIQQATQQPVKQEVATPQVANTINTTSTTTKQETKSVGPDNIIPANQLFVVSPNVYGADESEVTSGNKEEDVKKNEKNNVNSNINTSTNANINVRTNKPQVTVKEVKPSVTSVKESSSANNISEVKVIKSKEPVGTVGASTVSLYNQYIATGNKAKNAGQYQRAIEYYVNALALKKSDELSANIALMYLKLKNPNMAFQVSVTNGMKDTKLLSQLAVLMIQSKYYLEAGKIIQYANTFNISSDVLFASGYLNQSQNQLENALKFYEDSVALDGNIQSAYYAGNIYENKGMKDDAKRMYNVIISSENAPKNIKNQATQKLKNL